MNRFTLSRREFLESSVAAGAGVACAHLAGSAVWGEDVAGAEAAADSVAVPAWASRAMRWEQLTLVEDDPGKFDPQFWLDYYRRSRADGVCLSGGGCVAYYPTQIPFHHRSAWLGDRDVLGELINGCRKLGMSVLVRTDPHATYDDVKAAHPDWIAVDARGSRGGTGLRRRCG